MFGVHWITSHGWRNAINVRKVFPTYKKIRELKVCKWWAQSSSLLNCHSIWTTEGFKKFLFTFCKYSYKDIRPNNSTQWISFERLVWKKSARPAAFEWIMYRVPGHYGWPDWLRQSHLIHFPRIQKAANFRRTSVAS